MITEKIQIAVPITNNYLGQMSFSFGNDSDEVACLTIRLLKVSMA
jgi:hypothetical protein